VRGTAVVLRDGKLLLVRERGSRHFPLPGGRQERGDPWMYTAVREIKEELNLDVGSAERERRKHPTVASGRGLTLAALK